MLRLSLPTDAPPTLLCLGAHSDDIEIGCGGTVLTLLERHPGARVDWVVFSARGERAEEARAAAKRFLAAAGSAEVTLHTFRDGFFPTEFAAIKEVFEGLKAVKPDVVLTHRRADHHQDHRTLAELTWNTFRSHLVLEYEVPKYDPDLGNPNLFVPLARETAEAKVAELMAHFGSQRSRAWFTPDTFLGLMRLRGVQCASPTGLAEGFFAHKICL
jgi:LmbE family N-acetylglucosaminyl deacetylase